MKYFLYSLLFVTICATNTQAQITQKQINVFLNDSVIKTGIVGISIYEPATKKYLYSYNDEKNFVPSSNTKLFTLYAGLKYLGDSLLAAKVYKSHDSIYFQPTGDPTFLHKDFIKQPLLDFFISGNYKLCYVPFWNDKFQKWGAGWSWNDYGDYYMTERNRFPIYGNVWTVSVKDNKAISIPPNMVKSGFLEEFSPASNFGKKYFIARDFTKNKYSFQSSEDNFTEQEVPFITDELGIFNPLQLSWLKDTLHKQNYSITFILNNNISWKNFYSQPVDSMFRPMMYRSDNFFAEQTLLMVSNKKLGYMSDQIMIDSLLKTDLKDLPTKPVWVDGSGLSRYNLFSPKDFIFILEKLRNDFGIIRMKNILPTGGQGTLTNYYLKDAGFIYAKTGSMSGHVALSGYLFTKKDKMLEFSVIINNFIGSGRAARRAIEQLLQQIRVNN